MQADLIRDFNAISSQILATLLSFWLWLCKRVAALAKTYGLKFTRPALHYVAFFLPGPWMLLWAWQLPEYNVAKKMQHKLPQMLGGDALPSFISNPLELALAYLTLVVGVFAVVELGGLVLAAVRGVLCPAKAAPVAVAVAKEGAAEGEAVEEAPQRSTYSLSGLLKLAFLQGYCQLVLFCTDSSSSTFSAKYSLLAPLGITVSAGGGGGATLRTLPLPACSALLTPHPLVPPPPPPCCSSCPALSMLPFTWAWCSAAWASLATLPGPWCTA